MKAKTDSFAVYTTTPKRVHAEGNVQPDISDQFKQLAGINSHPVDIYVDIPNSRIVWYFTAKRRTRSGARQARFLAEYQGSHQNLFVGFRRHLLDLNETDEWELQSPGESRWETGLELPQIAAGVPGLDTTSWSALKRLLGDNDESLEFGMRDYEAALQTIKQLHADEVDCTVAIHQRGRTAETEGVDLVLRPDMGENFVPLSVDTERKMKLKSERFTNSATETPTESASVEDATNNSETQEILGVSIDTIGSSLGKMAGSGLILMLGFATASFVDFGPVHHLTGLTTLGGICATLLTVPVLGAMSPQMDLPTTSFWRRVLGEDAPVTYRSRHLVMYAMYGAFSAYTFPTLFRVVPTMMGLERWAPFGPVDQPVSAILSMALYIVPLSLVGIGLFRLWISVAQNRSFGRSHLKSVVFAHAIYAVVITLAAGLGKPLWYSLIPAAA